MTPILRADEIDRTIKRYSDAVGDLTVRLVGLEADPTMKLIEVTPLTGITATLWAEIRMVNGRLWTDYEVMRDLVARAEQLRGDGTWADQHNAGALTVLLSGPSLTVPDESGVSLQMTPPQLLDRVHKGFATVETFLSKVSKVWNETVPQLHDVSSAVVRLRHEGEGLGGATRQLDAVDSAIEELRTRAGTDPLSVQDNELGDVHFLVGHARENLGQLITLKGDLSEEVAQARRDLDRLRAEVERGRRIYSDTAAKLGTTSLPEPLDIDPSLEGRLSNVEALGSRGEWVATRTQLAQWRTLFTRAIDEVTARNRAMAELLSRRSELRGRLDAYRAKANGMGLLEHNEVDALYDQALEMLHTSPCDLDTAEGLVSEYNRAIMSERGKR